MMKFNNWKRAVMWAALVLFATPSVAFAEGSGWSGTTQLIGLIVNFLILVALIGNFGMRKVRVSLQTRKEMLEREMREASRLHDEAEAKLNEIEQRMSQLDAETQRILDEYRSLGEAERRHIIRDAEEQARRLRYDAQRAAEHEMSQAQRSVREQVLKAAMNRAETQLVEQMSASQHQKQVDRYIDSLAAMVVSDAQSAKN